MRREFLFIILVLALVSTAPTPNPGHDASSIGSGTFSVGNYTFPANVNVTGITYSSEICLDGTCRTTWPAGGSSMWTNTSNNATFTSGNVGIGTTTPTDRLTVDQGSIFQTANATPVHVGSYSDTGYEYDVAMQGKLAVTIPHRRVFDISNPENPVHISTFTLSGDESTDIAMAGDYAYVLTNNFHLNVVDLSDPFNPKEISATQIAATIDPQDITIQGNYVYISTSNHSAGPELYIIDISNPQTPVTVGTFEVTEQVREIHVQDNFVYIGINPDNVADPIRVLNVTDVSAIEQVGNISGYYTNFDVSWPYIYAKKSASNFAVINISDPTNVTEVAELTASAHMNYISAQGRYVYATSEVAGGEISVIDVSDPSNPFIVFEYDATSVLDKVLTSIHLQGNYLYASASNGSAWGIEVFELAGTATPSIQTGVLQTDSLYTAQDAFVGGSIVSRRAAIGVGGIFSQGSIFAGNDVTVSGILNTSQICLGGVCETSWPASGSSMWTNTSNNATYVAGNVGIGTTTPTDRLTIGNGSVRVENTVPLSTVSNLPANTQDTGYGSKSVYVQGDYAFVGDQGYEWRIYDTSDIENPELLFTHDSPAPTNAFALQGNYLYVSHDSALKTYDVSNLREPIEVDSQAGVINDLKIQGSYLFTGGQNGVAGQFRAYSLANPAQPELISQYEYNNTDAGGIYQIQEFALDKDVAYIAAYDAAIAVNISDKSNMALLWNQTRTLGGRYAFGLDLVGSHLYIGGVGNGLYVLDISNRTEPVVLDVETTDLDIGPVRVAGDYLYAYNQSHILTYDVTNRSNLQPVGSYSAPGVNVGFAVWHMVVQGNYLYITRGDSGVDIIELGGITSPHASFGTTRAQELNVDRRLVVGGATQIQDGLTVGPGGISTQGDIMTSSTLNASQVCLDGTCRTTWPSDGSGIWTNSSGSATYTAGNVGVGTASPSELLTVSNGSILVETPGVGTLLGVLDSTDPTNGDVRHTHVSGRYAYTSDSWFNLSVFDISNPNNPRRLSMFDFSGASTSYQSGQYLYANNQVLNISNPSDISSVATITYPASTTVYALHVAGTLLYALSFNSTSDYLSIVDISDPTSPTTISDYAVGQGDQWRQGIQKQNDLLYLTTGYGLYIIDVSDPTNPRQLGNYTAHFSSKQAEVLGSYAYVAGWGSGFYILDVSDPTNIILTDRVISPDHEGVAVVGKYAYAPSSDTNETIVYDVSNVSNIVEVGRIDLGTNQPNDITVHGKYAYVSGSEGTQIIALPGIEAPTAQLGSVQTETATVTGRLDVIGEANILTGLSVGSSGIRTDGAVTGESVTAQEICLGGVCETSWPAGGSGLWTNSSGNATYIAGNVGIGTTSPTAALEIDGGVRLNTSTARPTCGVNQRGTMWFEQSTSGSDDFLWGCMRNSTDGYNWIMVARGG